LPARVPHCQIAQLFSKRASKKPLAPIGRASTAMPLS
jgi:hypothetical protein